MSVPLERPELPVVAKRLVWADDHVVSIFGPGDSALAASIAEHRDASIVHLSLRHGMGFETTPTRITAHPDALVPGLVAWREALQPTQPPSLIVGVGAAFAVAVQAHLSIWIADGLHPIALPSALRPVATEASLILESVRPGLAAELARHL